MNVWTQWLTLVAMFTAWLIATHYTRKGGDTG